MVKKNNRRRIEDALAKRDFSSGQLAAELHIGNATAWRWLQRMVEEGDAFVCAKKLAPHGGPEIAIYRAGKRPVGFVVRKQKAKTPAERTSKYRKGLFRTGDWEDVKARQRASYWRSRQVKRDPLTAAFFGSAA